MLSSIRQHYRRIKGALNPGRAVRLVLECTPGWTLVSSVLVVIQGLLPLVSLYLMKLIVDGVTAAVAAPDKGPIFARVALLIGLAGAVALLAALCRAIAALASEVQIQTVTDHVQDILHAKSIEVDLEYYENPKYYDTLHRAQREAPFRPTRIVGSLIQMTRSGISLLAMVGLLLFLHWGVAAALFLASLPGIFVRLRYARKVYRWQLGRTPTERRAWYLHWILTGDTHAKEVRLFGLGPLLKERFGDLRKSLRRERLRLARRRSGADFLAQTCAIVAVFGSFVFIAYRTVLGAISLGSLVMYYQAFQRAQNYLRELLSSLAGLYEDNLFLTSFYEFLAQEPRVLEPDKPRPVPYPLGSGIVFKGVSFRYPGGARNVLEDINLEIRPGETVALVGKNGSGKTTLIKLLCRLYDPTAGSITVDGIDLRQFQTTALRRQMSVIFQDYARFNLKARENIWFGNIDLPPDHEDIIRAAQRAGAHALITGLKHGYDTILGKWFEDGEELSIGEWQKLALARVFLRDTPIIVLDEPTSAMDALAEYELFQQFSQLTGERAVILISHRFSTVRMADRIYVLEDGRVVESGTHEDLVQQGGQYAQLYGIQATHYK